MFKRIALSRLGKALKLDTIYYNNPLYGRTGSLKGRRQYVQDYAHYVHKSQVLMQKAFDFWEASSRTIMAYYHPFQHANIFKVADAIASDGIIICKKEDEDEESPEPMKITQNKWERNEGDLLLKKAIEKGRMHGLILYVPFKGGRKYLPDYWTGPPWKVYGLDEFQIVDWDTNGHPIEFSVNPTNKKVEPFTIGIKDCYFFDPELTDDYDGLPQTASAWDSMVDWLFEHESMTGFDQRLANGFMILPTMLGTSDSVKTAYEQKMKNVRTEMGLIWEVDPDLDQKPEWQDISGAGNFPEHLTKLEEAIATAIGFPLRWLKGMEAGALSAASEDGNQVFAKLRSIFKTWTRFVIGVCLFHKWIASAENIAIKHGFQMEKSDMDMAEIDSIKATTIAASTWLTVNEMRERDGLGPVDGGDEMFVDKEAENQKDIDDNNSENNIKEEKSKPKPEAKGDSLHEDGAVDADGFYNRYSPNTKYGQALKNPDDAVNVSSALLTRAAAQWEEKYNLYIQKGFDIAGAKKKADSHIKSYFSQEVQHALHIDSKAVVRDYFQTTPVRKIAEFTGMSTGYVSKIRSKFDAEKPKPHEDYLTLKMDSVQIDENTWEFEGPFVAPLDAKYSGIRNIRNPEQIAEWWKSPTPKEFYIGVNSDDSHASPIKAEVLRDDAVGIVKAINLTPDGQVIGKYRIEMDKVRKRLGDENWVLDHAKNQKDIPVSVALWSRDVDRGEYVENTELDVRSVVLTRSPRNTRTKIN